MAAGHGSSTFLLPCVAFPQRAETSNVFTGTKNLARCLLVAPSKGAGEVSSSRHWTSVWNGCLVGRLGWYPGASGSGAMVLASSQDTWGVPLGKQAKWSSGSAAWGKALEKGGPRSQARATTGYRAWRENWAGVFSPLPRHKGSVKPTTSGCQNCYREATGPKARRGGTKKKRHLWTTGCI